MASCGPSVDVACIAISRMQAREQYVSHDYQVCLLEGKRVLRGKVEVGIEPDKAALCTVNEHTGLRGNTAVHLSVYTKADPHTVTILYAIPIPSSDVSGSCVQFYSLSSVMTSSDQEDRDMLCSLEQWLHERHALPFVDLTLLFLGGGNGGVVKALIENPVYLCSTPPPEDKLVISLNNPTFSTSYSTLDLHATQA